MKTYLLPERGEFYKANLHCHTTLSDGDLTPEQVKEEYGKRGYQIVAYTDHEVVYCHNDLSDDTFLAINGYEIDISDSAEPDGHFRRCYHFNAYALESGDTSALLPKPAYGDMPAINRFIQKLNDSGFLVCYNHPYWSLQTMDDYRSLDGLFAVEILNYGAYNGDGVDGEQAHVYDTMLRLGKRLCCVAADDNHNRRPLDHPQSDSFGGFVMIKAENLDYTSVMTALKNGDFYASSGPEIYALYAQDGRIHVRCSPAIRISLQTAGRRCGSVVAREGETFSEAAFEFLPKDRYIRIEVTDRQGKRANSRAYFTEELTGVPK